MSHNGRPPERPAPDGDPRQPAPAPAKVFNMTAFANCAHNAIEHLWDADSDIRISRERGEEHIPDIAKSLDAFEAHISALVKSFKGEL